MCWGEERVFEWKISSVDEKLYVRFYWTISWHFIKNKCCTIYFQKKRRMEDKRNWWKWRWKVLPHFSHSNDGNTASWVFFKKNVAGRLPMYNITLSKILKKEKLLCDFLLSMPLQWEKWLPIFHFFSSFLALYSSMPSICSFSILRFGVSALLFFYSCFEEKKNFLLTKA